MIGIGVPLVVDEPELVVSVSVALGTSAEDSFLVAFVLGLPGEDGGADGAKLSGVAERWALSMTRTTSSRKG